jgi:hypothetical protein
MLMPHSITHGDACLAYFNKIRGIPLLRRLQTKMSGKNISILILGIGRTRISGA